MRVPYEFQIYRLLMNGEAVDTVCMGPSMEPVYFDREPIRIFPFNDDHPDPVVGDVVHFYERGFNRHQVADIFVASDGVTWYRLAMGDGGHDQFVTRDQCIGWVVPHSMLEQGLTPADTYDTIEQQREEYAATQRWTARTRR